MKELLLFIGLVPLSLVHHGQHFIPILKPSDELQAQGMYCDGDIYDLEVWNDTMICGGNFHYFFGEFMPFLARWDGQEAHPFQPAPNYDFINRVTDITPFYNQLIICGSMPEYNGAAIFDGNNWNYFGLAGDNFLPEIEVFNDDLYTYSDNALYTLENEQWSGAFTGILGDIHDIQVYGNKLYIAADSTLSAFDGTDWYTFPITFDEETNLLSVADDRLFITGKFNTDNLGNNYNGLAEIIGNSMVPVPMTWPLGFGAPGRVYNIGDQFLYTNFFEQLSSIVSTPTKYYHEENPTSAINLHSPSDMLVHEGKLLAAINDDTQFSSKGLHQLVGGSDFIEMTNGVVSPIISPTSTHFHKPENSAGFHFPTESQASTSVIYSAALWMYGITESDTIVTANTFNSEQNFTPGPIAEVTTEGYLRKYLQAYQITEQQINEHLASYSDPNYVMPEVFLNWPAHGDVSNGEAYYLAPYTDANENGVYEPELGDTPAIRGHQCAYYILNDKRDLAFGNWSDEDHLMPDSLNIEMHVMMYTYSDQLDAVEHALFVNYRIINRSDNDYDKFRCAMWTDFDIGNSTDDYVGCDSLLNFYYGYNGDADDQSVSTSYGYGQYPAASACHFLNQNLTSALYYNIGSSPINGDPIMDKHYFNFMNSRWKNGGPVFWGGNGINGTGVQDFEANYMFPSYPWESEGLIWNETQANNPTGDRRMLGSGEEIFLGSNEEFCFDIAYVVARDTTTLFEPHLASLQLLKSYIPQVQQFYNEQNNTCYKNITEPTENNGTNDNDWFQIYPNPGGDQIAISVPYDGAQYQIVMYNSIGQLVMDTTVIGDKPFQSIDTKNLADAGYLIGLRKGDEWVVRKWIKISEP